MKIEELALKVAKEMYPDWHHDVTSRLLPAYATRFLAAYTKQQEPVIWSYCPECGSEELHHEEGMHKQCGNCHQEWFSDIDYSDVVQHNLSKLYAAPVVPADHIADLERQVAALTKERDAWREDANISKASIDMLKGQREHQYDQLSASQAREAKLRELWEAVEKEYFARLKEQDEEAAKFEAEKDMYGWNFHKGLRGGLVEFHIYMTKIAKVLALHTDDSALQARLKEEREKVAQMILNGSFLHTEAPVAIWAREVAAAIRRIT